MSRSAGRSRVAPFELVVVLVAAAIIVAQMCYLAVSVTAGLAEEVDPGTTACSDATVAAVQPDGTLGCLSPGVPVPPGWELLEPR
jgi:hypothetical protein